VLKEQ